LKLERQFTFSSSASDFLKKSGFDFSKVFTDGVPYLSRHEEYERQEENSARADKKLKIPDIPINPDDVQTVEFMRYARKTVKDWVKESKNKPEVDYCNIGYPGKEDTPLNSFQRRLIYQIIRNEFPTLQCFARSDGHFMQVKKLDVKAELEVCCLICVGYVAHQPFVQSCGSYPPLSHLAKAIINQYSYLSQDQDSADVE
jgi:poly(A)-specific ribonuclease